MVNQDTCDSVPFSDIGRNIAELIRAVAVRFGLQETNPGYKRLSPDTPLYINCEPYVVKKNQSDGEKDLISLADTIPYEGSWFYTPTDSNWYHVSRDHREEFSAGGGFKLESILFDGTFTVKDGELIHYHTHPRIAGQHAVRELSKNPMFNDQTLNQNVLNAVLSAYSYVHLSFPSTADIETCRNMQKQFQHHKGTFEGRIASPAGITIIRIHDPYDQRLAGYSVPTEGEIVQNGMKINQTPGETDIQVIPGTLFKSINQRMNGAMQLEFLPAEHDSLAYLG